MLQDWETNLEIIVNENSNKASGMIYFSITPDLPSTAFSLITKGL